MKIVALYRPDSEHARRVEEYAHDYERTRGTSIELVSLETVQGASMAKLYDIVSYPAVLVLRDDAQLVQSWQRESLPLMGEVDAFYH